MESSVQSWRPRANAFCDFTIPWYSMSLKYCASHTKSSSQNWSSLAGLVLHLPRKMHLCRSSSNVPLLPTLLKLLLLQNLHVLLTFDKVQNPLRRPRATTSERLKVVRTCRVFNILPWKCASCHNSVHFFDISTSRSAPNLVCFAHYDLEMCFAPACTFSSSQLPKVVWDRQFFALLPWKCASRHNGVHFFDISTSKSAPNLVCFAHFDFGNVLRASVHFFNLFLISTPKVVWERQFFALLTWALFHHLTTSKSAPRPSRFNTFDFEMCFAPQWLSLSRHLNFQKWPEHEVFCAFWLGNVLRAAAAYTFSTSQFPKVLRDVSF